VIDTARQAEYGTDEDLNLGQNTERKVDENIGERLMNTKALFPFGLLIFLTFASVHDGFSSSLEGDRVDVYIIHDYCLAGAEGMLTANHGANLVLYGPGGVFLFPNPRTLKPGNAQPETSVRSWKQY